MQSRPLEMKPERSKPNISTVSPTATADDCEPDEEFKAAKRAEIAAEYAAAFHQAKSILSRYIEDGPEHELEVDRRQQDYKREIDRLNRLVETRFNTTIAEERVFNKVEKNVPLSREEMAMQNNIWERIKNPEPIAPTRTSISDRSPSFRRTEYSRRSPQPEYGETPPRSPLGREPDDPHARRRYDVDGPRQDRDPYTPESRRVPSNNYARTEAPLRSRSNQQAPSETETETETETDEGDTDAAQDSGEELSSRNRLRRAHTEEPPVRWVPPARLEGTNSKVPQMPRRASINSTSSGPSRPPSAPVRTPSAGIRSDYFGRDSPSSQYRNNRLEDSPPVSPALYKAASGHSVLSTPPPSPQKSGPHRRYSRDDDTPMPRYRSPSEDLDREQDPSHRSYRQGRSEAQKQHYGRYEAPVQQSRPSSSRSQESNGFTRDAPNPYNPPTPRSRMNSSESGHFRAQQQGTYPQPVAEEGETSYDETSATGSDGDSQESDEDARSDEEESVYDEEEADDEQRYEDYAEPHMRPRTSGTRHGPMKYQHQRTSDHQRQRSTPSRRELPQRVSGYDTGRQALRKESHEVRKPKKASVGPQPSVVDSRARLDQAKYTSTKDAKRRKDEENDNWHHQRQQPRLAELSRRSTVEDTRQLSGKEKHRDKPQRVEGKRQREIRDAHFPNDPEDNYVDEPQAFDDSRRRRDAEQLKAEQDAEAEQRALEEQEHKLAQLKKEAAEQKAMARAEALQLQRDREKLKLKTAEIERMAAEALQRAANAETIAERNRQKAEDEAAAAEKNRQLQEKKVQRMVEQVTQREQVVNKRLEDTQKQESERKLREMEAEKLAKQREIELKAKEDEMRRREEELQRKETEAARLAAELLKKAQAQQQADDEALAKKIQLEFQAEDAAQSRSTDSSVQEGRQDRDSPEARGTDSEKGSSRAYSRPQPPQPIVVVDEESQQEAFRQRAEEIKHRAFEKEQIEAFAKYERQHANANVGKAPATASAPSPHSRGVPSRSNSSSIPSFERPLPHSTSRASFSSTTGSPGTRTTFGQSPRHSAFSTSGTSTAPQLSAADWARRQEELAKKQEEQFRKEQEKNERLRHQKGAPLLTASKIAAILAAHEQRWVALDTKTGIKWDDIPWPILGSALTEEDITAFKVESYVLSPHNPASKSDKDRIKEQLKRWHPDRFNNKYSTKFASKLEQETVTQAAGVVTRVLSDLLMKQN